MRKSATTDSDIIKVLALNTEIILIGEEGDWYKVKSSEDVGYIAKRLVSDQKKETKLTIRKEEHTDGKSICLQYRR